jgi:hypothetical protein
MGEAATVDGGVLSLRLGGELSSFVITPIVFLPRYDTFIKSHAFTYHMSLTSDAQNKK